MDIGMVGIVETLETMVMVANYLAAMVAMMMILLMSGHAIDLFAVAKHSPLVMCLPVVPTAMDFHAMDLHS